MSVDTLRQQYPDSNYLRRHRRMVWQWPQRYDMVIVHVEAQSYDHDGMTVKDGTMTRNNLACSNPEQKWLFRTLSSRLNPNCCQQLAKKNYWKKGKQVRNKARRKFQLKDIIIKCVMHEMYMFTTYIELYIGIK